VKAAGGKLGVPVAATRAVAGLHMRLAEAEETLRAIRSGEADAVVTAGKHGTQVFTLEGADHAYRVLIESMNEGALTMTATKTILYANQCFARMVKCPLEQVIGGSLRRFLSAADRAALRSELKRANKTGSKIQLVLNVADGSHIPVQVSIRPLAKHGFSGPTFGLVVTDMTEAQRTERLLRALTQRVVQVQEDERGRLALELHDNITQLLCAVLFRSQSLADQLSVRDGPAKIEATKLREILGQTAEAVERISRDLRPSVLEHLGLAAVLRDTGTKFAARTGVAVTLTSVKLTARVPADTELALYRIFQEALQNVEKHARASHVTVSLMKMGDTVHFTVRDDGAGFNPKRHRTGPSEKGALGLLGMRERASYVGGVFTVKSGRRTGTEIEVRVPLPQNLG
jgi:two-component system, NarL family, sensor kinase